MTNSTFSIEALTPKLLAQHHESLMHTYSALVASQSYDLANIEKVFGALTRQGSKIFVALEETCGIVGAVTVLIEYKITRGGVKAAHIEDLAVLASKQGQGIGNALLTKAIAFAQEEGAYKIILDCEEALVHYYEKKGFQHQGVFMRKYL